MPPAGTGQPLDPRSPLWERLLREAENVNPLVVAGRVTRVVGLRVESQGPQAGLGELCRIRTGAGDVLAEVVGLHERRLLLMPLGSMEGLAVGDEVVALRRSLQVAVGEELLGRILDGLGRPIDGQGFPRLEEWVPVHRSPPDPLRRRRVTHPLSLGLRVVDGLLTCGEGQRLGIFAGSGVGKSTLLGMVARGADADVVVIGLIGERGREVREFIERDLGAGRERSVVVVATSDEPALVRIRAAEVATAVAEFFRDRGRRVLLLLDSITRVAAAQREVGLAVGEPPTTRGYPPSVFALLPRLLERAGQGETGSITAFYTVLVDGDDLTEPVTDTVRSILDGHLVLSRELAEAGRYPAVDVLASVSRVMGDVVSPEHRQAALAVRQVLSARQAAADLIAVGAYQPGSDPKVDAALREEEALTAFLTQDVHEVSTMEETHRALLSLAERLRGEGA